MLALYAKAMAGVQQPAAYAFEYAYERHGALPQARTDRVYRQADRERDEILSINGEKFTAPEVRIFQGRRERYAVTKSRPVPTPMRFRTSVRSETARTSTTCSIRCPASRGRTSSLK